jgi:NAD-dependent deacetylase
MVDKLVELIKESNGVVVLTGAGISTDSGIPDFRGRDGLWNKINPEEVLHANTLKHDPKKFYEYFFKVFDVGDAKPNKGHISLAELEKKGIIKAIITQNIDGLHRAAGSQNVLEVHGTMATCSCAVCGETYNMQLLRESVDKGIYHRTCIKGDCEGTVRPDVVLFGDMLPECFNKAAALVRQYDLLIAIGTSLNVWPVAGLAEDCRKLAIINKGGTAFDGACTLRIEDSISDVLEQLNRRF